MPKLGLEKEAPTSRGSLSRSQNRRASTPVTPYSETPIWASFARSVFASERASRACFW